MNLCQYIRNVINHCLEDLSADGQLQRKLVPKVQIFNS